MWKVADPGSELPHGLSVWENDHLVQVRCGACARVVAVFSAASVSGDVLYLAAWQHYESAHDKGKR